MDEHYIVPFDVYSFQEAEELGQIQELVSKYQALFEAFCAIAYNIEYSDLPNKREMLDALRNEFASRVESIDYEEENEEKSLFFWKSKEGKYRLFGIYSNNRVDRDGDIIEAAAHKEYIEAVETGQYPYPEIWLWHEEDYKFGQVDLLGFDEDSGMAYFSGTVDLGKEVVVDYLNNYPAPLGMSHGMPKSEVQRRDEDRRVIKRYRDKEVTVLPLTKAANLITSVILEEDISLKENEMSGITPEKAKFLIESGLDVTKANEVLKNSGERADNANLEKKEADATPVTATETAAPASAPAPEVLAAYATKTEVAEVVGELVLEPLADLTKVVNALMKELQSTQAELKELRQSDSEKIAKAAADTPAFSIKQLLSQKVAVGNVATQIDGRSTLAKDGPEESKSDSESDPFKSVYDGLANGSAFRKRIGSVPQN